MKNTGKESTVNPTQYIISQGLSSRQSFSEAIKRAEQQIDISSIENANKNCVRELCYIIAEIYLMNPESRIKISGELLDVYLVQQVFGEITCDHVRLVIDNFNKNTNLVKNKKAYLRAALYNSVFEFEFHYKNLVNHDLPK